MGKRVKPLASPDTEQAFSATLLGQAVRAKRTQSQLRLEDAAAAICEAKQKKLPLLNCNSDNSCIIFITN